MDTLTKVQNDTRDKAWEMLKEHFDNVVLIIETEAQDGTDRLFLSNYHGGITVGIGMCERASYRFKEGDVEETD